MPRLLHHISVRYPSNEWLEPVDDEQYGALEI